ncbi:hypothetical protein [Mucilaginibacter gilvus]|uniref:Uncharacterized protein n=1 Tax=Mucilaginibacter gilvus TaxID=2305909 RepID=A0A3S3UP96_9SPHI|nr:hypothetical protein [Mucilaginibacter gilvus]RWY51108.1 hypothetical protein EPL05_13660 [Mucilaginibacter gilvus]
MRQWIAVILFIALSVKGYSQTNTDSLIKTLVSAAYKEIVNPKAKFYYLYEKGESLNSDDWDIYEFKNEKERLADVPLDELIALIKTDTTSIDWKNYNLANARCLKKPLYKYSYSYKISNIVSYTTPDSVINKLMDNGIIPVIPTKKTCRKNRWLSRKKKARNDMKIIYRLKENSSTTLANRFFLKNLIMPLSA